MEISGSSEELAPYINFIRISYGKTVKASCSYFVAIPVDLFIERFNQTFTHLLSKSMVRLMVLKEGPEVIIGYSIYHDNILSVVFVKRIFRKQGLMAALIPEGITDYATFIKKENHWLLEKFPALRFNPYD